MYKEMGKWVFPGEDAEEEEEAAPPPMVSQTTEQPQQGKTVKNHQI